MKLGLNNDWVLELVLFGGRWMSEGEEGEENHIHEIDSVGLRVCRFQKMLYMYHIKIVARSKV